MVASTKWNVQIVTPWWSLQNDDGLYKMAHWPLQLLEYFCEPRIPSKNLAYHERTEVSVEEQGAIVE